MMQSPLPRHFMPSAALAGVGLPNDRQARLAARRAFVELKLTFIEAVRALPPERGTWLARLVRDAEEPVDLWLLRAPMFAALSGPEPELRVQRLRLRRGLDTLFPDNDPQSGFSVL